MWQGRLTRATALCLLLSALLLPWLGQIYAPRLERLWIAREVAERMPPPEARPPLAAAGYHEPSLVFLAGTDTRLSDVEGVARHLSANPGAYGLVTEALWPRFQAAAMAHGLTAEAYAHFPGFNYSKGKALNLIIIRTNVPSN